MEILIECWGNIINSYSKAKLIKDFSVLHGVLLRVGEISIDGTCQVSIRGSLEQVNHTLEAVCHFLKLTGCSVSDHYNWFLNYLLSGNSFILGKEPCSHEDGGKP